jgi:hypothetical protein
MTEAEAIIRNMQTRSIVPPMITVQPVATAANDGATATFTANASGTLPMTCQWYKNSSIIPGATSVSYTTPTLALADSGATYYVIFTNAAGTVTSNTVALTVNPVLATMTGPAGSTVTEGNQATFSVTVTGGTSPRTFQWFKNGSLINGATSSSYTTPATAHSTDNGANFYCQVTNAAGMAQSGDATLTVTPIAVTITTQPTNQSVTEGQTATFSLVANTGTNPKTYQWYRGGSLINGATTASYTTPVTVRANDDGATFYCRVTNAAGMVQSNTVSLAVASATVVTTTVDHLSAYSRSGSDYGWFTKSALGDQWRINSFILGLYESSSHQAEVIAAGIWFCITNASFVVQSKVLLPGNLFTAVDPPGGASYGVQSANLSSYNLIVPAYGGILLKQASTGYWIPGSSIGAVAGCGNTGSQSGNVGTTVTPSAGSPIFAKWN